MINHPTTPPIAQISIVMRLMGISSSRNRFVRKRRITPITPVDDKSPRGSQPRYQKQNYQYNQDDEDDRLHKATISP
jgi:hypothetical protein